MNLDRVIAVRNNKTVYRDGDRCIKVFGAGFHKTDVLAEALNQAKMEQRSIISVPRVLEVTEIDGKWALVTEYIKGQSLAALMEREPGLRSEHLALLARLQDNTFHAHVAGLAPLSGFLTERLLNCDHLSATTRYGLHRRLREIRDDLRDYCPLHGDLEPSNILIAEDGTPYILDWSHVTLGTREADVATTYLLIGMRYGMDAAEEYLGYILPYPGNHEAIRSWLPIIAAARSVESNEAERAFLLPFVGR